MEASGTRHGRPAPASDLRIPPMRRQPTLNADAWGLRSVPGVLSDFQRHTSHTVHPVPTAPIQEGPLSYLRTIPALVALPTALSAAQHLAVAVGPLLAGLLVMGAVLTGAGPVAILDGNVKMAGAKINTLKMASGVFACVVAAWSLPASWAVAAGIAASSLRLVKEKAFSGTSKYMWYMWFALLAVWQVVQGNTSAALGLPCLCYSFWWLADPEADIDPVASLSSGVVSLVVAFVVFSPAVPAVTIAAIAAAAFGVFLLVRRDMYASRINATAGGGATYAILQAFHFGAGSPLALLAVVPTLLIPVAESDEAEAAVSEKDEAALPNSASVLDSILAHEDTRNIFYFFLLNFSFMLVQLLYSILSHSLGLLSDSIHMFFDCLALLVGLVASILAKLPPSPRFPYGLALVETVSGFANGCLLLAISVGIIFEAIERLYHPVEIEKVAELMIVSLLGLLVNMVGIFAFNHGHAHGHSHGHSHSAPVAAAPAHSSHGHDHGHSGHDDHNSHDHSSHSSHSCQPNEHSHESDNLHGIFLHIVADTLGSVGVIISTVLTYYFGWPGFDAVASLIIAVLIFVSALPLVIGSAKTLLLGLSLPQEYDLRDTLNDISTTSGVISYSVPKFWSDGQGIRGSLHVQLAPGVSGKSVREKVESKLKAAGIDKPVIQIEECGPF